MATLNDPTKPIQSAGTQVSNNAPSRTSNPQRTVSANIAVTEEERTSLVWITQKLRELYEALENADLTPQIKSMEERLERFERDKRDGMLLMLSGKDPNGMFLKQANENAINTMRTLDSMRNSPDVYKKITAYNAVFGENFTAQAFATINASEQALSFQRNAVTTKETPRKSPKEQLVEALTKGKTAAERNKIINYINLHLGEEVTDKNIAKWLIKFTNEIKGIE